MSSSHMKRLAMPRSWPLTRKTDIWISRPRPSGHPIERCMALGVVLRDVLGVAQSMREAKRALATGSQTILQEPWQKVLASSGSAKVLATVLEENKVTDGTITLDGLTYIREKSLAAKSIDQLDLAGLKPQRRDLIIPGMCIMQALMETFSLTEVHYSNAALREGLLETSAIAYNANRRHSSNQY